jgi:hypothetical protein
MGWDGKPAGCLPGTTAATVVPVVPIEPAAWNAR